MKRVLSVVLALALAMSVLGTIPVTVSAASMSDADFFSKFDYDGNPGLSTVKSFVDKGDYDGAKAALLQYFKDRKETSTITGYGITEADEFYGMAVLPMRNILTGPYEFDMWQAEFTVTDSSFETYEVDVTERIVSELNNGAVSFMLFAGDKQQYPVYVKSKESGEDVAPKLVVEYDIDGNVSTVTITANNDTYIASGATGSTYGTVSELVIKEDGTGGNSTGSNTRRAYVNFPLDEAANSTVLSAKLVLTAAYAEDCTTGDKDVLVINVGDTIWSENSLTWAGTRGSIYSYQNAAVPTWAASAPNADSEYHNVTSRFWFGRPMAYEYLSYLEDPELYNETHPYSDVYPGEDFGPKLVELMDAFATQRAYGYTRTLETGERLNRWVDIVDAFLETDVFDTRLDEFCNILSFMWGDCNYLAGLSISNGSYWWSNWRIVANAGFFKAVEYLPEFAAHDGWRSTVEYNVEYTFDLLYNDDYSFTEAGPSYSVWCVKLFGDCIKAADMSGNPMSKTFIEKVKYATRNALESYYPNGYDTNIGDSNYRNQMYYFEALNEIFGGTDKVISSYVAGEDMGAEYLTRFYDSVNTAYMRNSWDPDEAVYINFTNNPADGHYHPDSNQVLMYAYGSPLLVDSGRYSYSSTNSIYNTLRTSASHNTIEAVGVNLGAHSAATGGNALAYSNTNDTFDFATTSHNGYSGTTHTRNVFFARKGFGIVTDYVAGSTSRTYRQNWHFMPSSNAEVKGTTAKTDFYNAPNITVAAASATNATIRDGYHSADYGLVAESEYASFEKVGATVKFDTLLYPERADEEIEAFVTDLAESDVNKAAIKITVDGKDAYYYVKNTQSADGVFGDYTTDAKMAYASVDEIMLVEGKKIEGLLESPNSIISIGITKNNGGVVIDGEKLVASTNTGTAIKIYAPDTNSVVLNGEEVEFIQDGDYIYAVASTVGEHISGIVERVYPDKDGYVASNPDYGNEGAIKTEYNQAQISWQNRNAYLAFDLSDFMDKNITSATLNMKMLENASAGNLHFYYLDYGTWTRDTLEFIMDSSKMPTHTTNSGAGFTGYSYRWSGHVANVANESWAKLSVNQLAEYMNVNNNYKFTWAMLSESGSAKFYSLQNEEENRPYLEITYDYTVSDEKAPTVTVNTYVDGELSSSETKNAKEGTIYLHDVTDTIDVNGEIYYFDSDNSSISTIIKAGDNVIDLYYVSAVGIDVEFTSVLGEKLKETITVPVSPFADTYTYPAAETIIVGDKVFGLEAEKSTLTTSVSEDAVLNAVYVRICDVLTDNLVYNGDFSETTNDGTNTFVTGWNGGYTNSVHNELSDVSYLSNAGAWRATTDTHFIYTEATEDESAYVTTPPLTMVNNGADYPWKSDASENYMAAVLTNWMRDSENSDSYLKAEEGKTYYISFDMKSSSVASWQDNVVNFGAVTVDGSGYTNKIPGTNGDIATLTSVLDSPIGRGRYIDEADTWTTVSTIATADKDGYFVFQLGWAHEWGQVSVRNFRIHEVRESKRFEISDGNVVYNSYDGEEATVIIAYYDSDNALIKAVSNKGDGETVSVPLEVVEDAVSFKAFVWKSKDGLKSDIEPLTSSLEKIE